MHDEIRIMIFSLSSKLIFPTFVLSSRVSVSPHLLDWLLEPKCPLHMDIAQISVVHFSPLLQRMYMFGPVHSHFCKLSQVSMAFSIATTKTLQLLLVF